MEHVIAIDATMHIIPVDGVRDAFPSVRVKQFDPEERLEEPQVLITANRWWDDAYLDALEDGDWVITLGAGYDRFPLDRFAEAGIQFSTSRGVNAAQVADHGMAMVLSVMRNLPTYYAQQQKATWDIDHRGMTHGDGTVCTILGLGHIGEELAIRTRAFGMDVRGVKRDVDAYDGVVNALFPPEQLGDALDGADILFVVVPHTEETEEMVSTPAFERLDDDAIVVNIGRGPVVDTGALHTALDNDVIATACLDVTDPEPLPADHPLWDRDDVLITPHCAGVTDGYATQFLEYFKAQFDAWTNGREIRNRVV